MKILPDLRQTQYRRTHPPGQDVEGHKFTYRQAAIDNQFGAEVEDAGRDDLADELNCLACAVAKAQDPKARGNVAGELLFPAALHLRLDRHRLEGFDPGDTLDQKGLIFRATSELLI